MKLLFFLCLLFIRTIDVRAQDTPSKIRDFTANSFHNITVEAGAKVEFVCDVIPGSPVGDIVFQLPDGITKSFENMYIHSSESVIYSEARNLGCSDGGTYKCMTIPKGSHQGEPMHKEVYVTATCPIKIPDDAPKEFEVVADLPVLSIPFVGIPDPSDVQLFKVDGDKKIPIKIKFNIKREEPKDKGDIILAVLEHGPAGVEGDYVLLASNAFQKGLPAQLNFKLVKQPEFSQIKDFKANSSHNLTIEEGNKVEFVCNIIVGTKFGDIKLQSPDGSEEPFEKHVRPSNDTAAFRKTKELSCEAGGTYKCVIHPEEGSKANSTHKDVIVLVTCPVKYPKGTPTKFEVDANKPVISIPFVGRPDPSDVKLYKVDGDARKQVSMSFKITRKTPKDKGNIIISIQEDNSEVEGSYVLIASNTVQQGHPAELHFQITAKSGGDSDGNNDLAVGLGIGIPVGVVIIVAIVVGVVYMRRRGGYNSV